MSLDTFDAAARAVLLGLADAAVRSIVVRRDRCGNRRDPPSEASGGPPARVDARSGVALFLPLAAWILPEIAVPLPFVVLTPAATLTDARIASAFTVESVEAAAATLVPFDADDPAGALLPGRGVLAWRAGRGWLAALRIEWNGGLIADLMPSSDSHGRPRISDSIDPCASSKRTTSMCR